MSHFLPVRDIGFCVAHEPRSPTADVIFIHGLNGHRSLTGTNSSREFWLPWLGKHLPDVRVWTYGYEADQIFDSREGLENSREGLENSREAPEKSREALENSREALENSREALDSHATQFLLKLSSCLLVRILF